MGAAAVEAADRPRLVAAAVEMLDRLEVELALEHGEGVVGRAVVDDGHLVLRVVDLHERPGRLGDDRRLAVDGRDDADRNRQRRRPDAIEAFEDPAPAPQPLLEHRVRDHRAVRAVHDDHVREAHDHGPLQEIARDAHPASSSGVESRRKADTTSRALSRAKPSSFSSISVAARRPLSPNWSSVSFAAARTHQLVSPSSAAMSPASDSAPISPTARAACDRTKNTSSVIRARSTCCTSWARLAPSTRAAAERTVPDESTDPATAAAF